MNWIAQPRALVEEVTPAFDQLSVPTDARESMNAPRMWSATINARSPVPAPWFQATAHALGEGAAAAEAA